jgi:hypothetical protein
MESAYAAVCAGDLSGILRIRKNPPYPGFWYDDVLAGYIMASGNEKLVTWLFSMSRKSIPITIHSLETAIQCSQKLTDKEFEKMLERFDPFIPINTEDVVGWCCRYHKGINEMTWLFDCCHAPCRPTALVEALPDGDPEVIKELCHRMSYIRDLTTTSGQRPCRVPSNHSAKALIPIAIDIVHNIELQIFVLGWLLERGLTFSDDCFHSVLENWVFDHRNAVDTQKLLDFLEAHKCSFNLEEREKELIRVFPEKFVEGTPLYKYVCS